MAQQKPSIQTFERRKIDLRILQAFFPRDLFGKVGMEQQFFELTALDYGVFVSFFWSDFWVQTRGNERTRPCISRLE